MLNPRPNSMGPKKTYLGVEINIPDVYLYSRTGNIDLNLSTGGSADSREKIDVSAGTRSGNITISIVNSFTF